MHRKIEAIGNNLLSLFVPKVDADACGTWGWKYFSSCYECGGDGCWAWCASGCGCDHSRSQCQ
ncbi:hypothetical protein ACFQ08_14085 [Streptosporangium algeriense]|uniref:Uncharacterized protein n=1 Tax=Streptosporangium algeriense TaxID=1682748 RepID=A0ABW3DSA8_9ACTN